MKTRFSIPILLAAAAALPVPALAANDWDLLSRTIPASACQVRDSAQAALVEMNQGAWRFAGASTGRVTLTCPLPISFFPADRAQNTNPTTMTFYRVWYRDSDAAGPAAAVTAIPYVRLWPSGTWSNIGLLGGGGGIVPPGVCQFSSNAFADVGFAAHTKDCKHDIQLNALYSFEVILSRTVSSQIAEFHGIDFHDGSTPAG